MNEIDIFSRSVKDFFSSQMLKIAIFPLIITLIILYTMFFMAADFGISALKDIAEASQNGQDIVLDESAPFYFLWISYLLVFLFKYSVVSWIAGFLFYTIGTIFVFHVSVIFTIIIIGFLTPFVVNNLHKKHYSHLKLNPYGTIMETLWVFFKAFFIMILLYILFVPLYFIPLINIIAFYFPLYYLFHKLLNFDVSSTILSKTQFEKIYEKDGGSFRLRTLLLYFTSTVPFVTLFIVVFYVIYLSNAYFIKLDELETKETKEQSETQKEEDIRLIPN